MPEKEKADSIHTDGIKAIDLIWSECRDSNPRPLGPEPSAIPNLDKLERAKCSDSAPIAVVFTTLLYQMIKRKAREICVNPLLFVVLLT